MRSSRNHPERFLLVAIALTLVMAGLATEAVLQREETRARGALSSAVARLDLQDDAAARKQLKHAVRTGRYDTARELLDDRVREQPTVESHAALAHAAAASGRFETAGRNMAFAARLQPRDEAARIEGERALDLALLGRARSGLRIAALLAAAFLAIRGLAARARTRRARERAAWVRSLDARIAVQVDGQGSHGAAAALVAPDAASVVADIFLRPRQAGGQPPRKGPTLSLVLSHAASNTSLRLTPEHDVRCDAVRIRLKQSTLARLLAQPGTWRLQARVDDRALGEKRIEVRGAERSHPPLHILAGQTV